MTDMIFSEKYTRLKEIYLFTELTFQFFTDTSLKTNPQTHLWFQQQFVFGKI